MSKAAKKSILYALGVLALIALAMWLRYASRHIFHSPAVNHLRSGIYGNTAQLRLRVSAVFLLHFRSSENGKYIQYSSIFGTLNWNKNPA